MTLIAGIAFLDEAYLISDSRISYSGNLKPSEDILMKVFQIAPKMLVAFTSENVDFTLEILRRVSVYSLSMKNERKNKFLLPHLIRKAKYEYNSLLKETEIKSPPKMDFIYCGIINKPQMFSSYLFFELGKQKKSFHVPEKIGKALRDYGEGIWNLGPPAPIIYKQQLPNNLQCEYIYLGWATGGSGQEICNEIEKEYPNIFDWDCGTTKGMILEMFVSDYIKNNNIPTVGGIIQV